MHILVARYLFSPTMFATSISRVLFSKDQIFLAVNRLPGPGLLSVAEAAAEPPVRALFSDS